MSATCKTRDKRLGVVQSSLCGLFPRMCAGDDGLVALLCAVLSLIQVLLSLISFGTEVMPGRGVGELTCRAMRSESCIRTEWCCWLR